MRFHIGSVDSESPDQTVLKVRADQQLNYPPIPEGPYFHDAPRKGIFKRRVFVMQHTNKGLWM